MNIELSPKYQPLFDTIARKEGYENIDTIIVVGGRLSSKSFTVSIAGVTMMANYNHRLLYAHAQYVACVACVCEGGWESEGLLLLNTTTTTMI